MHALKKFFVHSPGHYIASVILTAAVGVFRYFTLPEGVGSRFALYEILSVSGFVTFLIGALMTVSYFGAFDLFGYVFSPGRMGGGVRKYSSYADYSHKMAEKRANGALYFVPYYVVGIVVALSSNLFA